MVAPQVILVFHLKMLNILMEMKLLVIPWEIERALKLLSWYFGCGWEE